jgi:hypothetical protein
VETDLDGEDVTMAEKVHDFKSVGHPTLARMAKDAIGGEAQALLGSSGHEKILTKALEEGHDKKPAEVPGPTLVSSASTEADEWGRIFVFGPTKELVKVIRENVGKTYQGGIIHEVKTKSGKVFLANVQQLKGVK